MNVWFSKIGMEVYKFSSAYGILLSEFVVAELEAVKVG